MDLSTPFVICLGSVFVMFALFVFFTVANLNSAPRTPTGPSAEEIGMRFGAMYAYEHRNDAPPPAAPEAPNTNEGRLDFRDCM